MSIATELTRLAANRDAIKAAIEAKNPATAPTSALSSFPAAIASIPSGGGGGWVKPADWPDLHAVLQQYPDGGSSYTKALAVLFDMSAGRTVKLSNCPKVRYSDAPDIIADGSTTGTVTYTFSNDGRYGWAVLYIESGSYYLNPTLGSNVATVIPGPSSTSSSIGVLWASGIGRIAMTNGASKSVQCIDTVDDTGVLDSYNNHFSRSYDLRAFRVKKAVKATTTSLRNAFNACYRLCEIDTSDWDTSGVTLFESTFASCGALESVDISGWDASNATEFSIFAEAVALRTLIGDKSFSTLSVDSAKGPKVAFALNNSPNLSAESLRFIVNWVGTVTSATTLTLGAVNKAKLTADEIAVATAKGWTVS